MGLLREHTGMEFILPIDGEETFEVVCDRCGEVFGPYNTVDEAKECRRTELSVDCFYHSEDPEERKRRYPTWYELRDYKPAYRIGAGVGSFGVKK